MTDNSTIALVGFTTIEAAGIRSLLRPEHDISIDSFAMLGDFLPIANDYDACIVTSDVMAAALDFFLPRKSKVLVVCHGSSTAYPPTQSGGSSIIYENSDEIEIKGALLKFVENVSGNGRQTNELSSREIEVLKLIAAGKINKEIADVLCISINTVITHRKNISSKLGIKSASGLSLYAMMNGYI